MSHKFETHLNVFQGYDASGLFVCCELKVVQAVVVKDEPPPLPALVPPTLLPQPALLVRVEESMHEVISVILRDLKRLCLDAEINCFTTNSLMIWSDLVTSHTETPEAPWVGSLRH